MSAINSYPAYGDYQASYQQPIPNQANYNQAAYNPGVNQGAYNSGINQGTYNSNVSYTSPASHDPRYPVNHDPRYPVPVENDPTLRRSRFVDRQTNTRYDTYATRPYEYKYNLFSLIDEPWNRCCEVGKCGTCPGNECIARRTPKLDWL